MRSTVLLILAAAGQSVYAAQTLYELDNARATVYYDLTNNLCGDAAAGDPFTPNWGVTSGINGGIPFCEGQGTKSLADIGTNSIVAMNADMVIADPAKWCGKEVQIIDSSGNQLSISDGPLFIWDACAACASASIIDLSAMAFTDLKGGSCAGNNPEGLTVRVLDNNIMEWTGTGSGSSSGGGQSEPPTPSSASSSLASASGAPSSSSADALPTSSQGIPTFSNNIHDVVPSPTSSRSSGPSRSSSPPLPSTSETSSSGGCTFGAWQCDGLALQVCNYERLDAPEWVTIEQCPSKCDITGTGSVDCE